MHQNQNSNNSFLNYLNCHPVDKSVLKDNMRAVMTWKFVLLILPNISTFVPFVKMIKEII